MLTKVKLLNVALIFFLHLISIIGLRELLGYQSRICALLSGFTFFEWKMVLFRVTFYTKKTPIFRLVYWRDIGTFPIFMEFCFWVCLSLLHLGWTSIFRMEHYLGLHQIPKNTLFCNPKFCSSAENIVFILQQCHLMV